MADITRDLPASMSEPRRGGEPLTLNLRLDVTEARRQAHVLLFVAQMLAHVDRFNRDVVGLPIPDAPRVMSRERVDWSCTAMDEEVREFREACERRDVAEAADALLDLTFFALGRLVEMGVPAGPVWDEIDRANGSKVRGTLSKRPGSLGYDATKPPGWQAPDHSWLAEITPEDVVLFKRRAATRRGDMGFLRQTDGQVEVAEPAPLPAYPPRVVLLGHARHGKDTVAELLRNKYGYRFTSSSLWAAERIMMPAFERARGWQPYPSAEACFADRGHHREFWFQQIEAFNYPDGTALGRAIFEENDCYVGVRSAREFHALRNGGVLDGATVVWVDASSRLPPEDRSSCTVEPWMADYVLDNNGTLADLERNLDVLMAGRVLRV